jgi:hypothetical protein
MKTRGSMIVILNVQSDSAALSEYVIDELIANAVDRQQLDLIRAEQNFQLRRINNDEKYG